MSELWLPNDQIISELLSYAERNDSQFDRELVDRLPGWLEAIANPGPKIVTELEQGPGTVDKLIRFTKSESMEGRYVSPDTMFPSNIHFNFAAKFNGAYRTVTEFRGEKRSIPGLTADEIAVLDVGERVLIKDNWETNAETLPCFKRAEIVVPELVDTARSKMTQCWNADIFGTELDNPSFDELMLSTSGLMFAAFHSISRLVDASDVTRGEDLSYLSA